MKVELITIGDELLYGHTVDTNAAFIGDNLSEVGIELEYHTTVGDKADNLLTAIAQALKRVDIVITTGGLGPTHDDITKKVICKYFKRQLVFHEDILKELQKKYEAQGMTMPPINQNQALLPQGAKFLENSIGSALGIVIEENNKTFIAMPGVPKEMRQMLINRAIPLLKKKSGRHFIIHRKLRTIGIMESAIFEKIRDIIEEKSPVSIAFLPSFKGVEIRLTARSNDESKALKAIETVENKFSEKLQKYIFGYDKDELPEILGRELQNRKMTLAIAESCTGGMLGKIFTDFPDSSTYFLGGIISYSNDMKIKVLNVPALTIERHGAVSAETARYMAEGVKKLNGASLGVSITGIAGPTGDSAQKPIGLTYVGLVSDDSTRIKEFYYGKDRSRNRLRACYSAMDMIRRYLFDIE